MRFPGGRTKYRSMGRFRNTNNPYKIIQYILLLFLITSIFVADAPAFAQESKSTPDKVTDVGKSIETAEEATKKAKEEEKTEGEMSPKIPLPHFARYKHDLPEILLADKREGRYIIPVPQVGLDPDTGFNIGAAVAFFDNGKKDSPFFRITPYRQMIGLGFLVSSGDFFQILADYDQPYIFDSPFRVRAHAEVTQNPRQHYFGIGDRGSQLTYPGSNSVFGSYASYNNALNQVVNGRTYSKYDEYEYTRTGVRASAEYDLVGGLIRPLVGLQISHVWVDDYSGQVSKSGVVQENTHLRDDCQGGLAIGCNGGWDIFVKFGISFDNRDFEPNPTKGLFFELVGELSPKFLGSKFNYGRLSTDLRAFGKLMQWKNQLLVLAGRVFYQWQFGDIPFYSMDVLAFTDQDRVGLGGFSSLRGYKQGRFIGPVAMMTNMELRYTFAEATIFRQNLRFGFKPFFDAGRVFDKVSETTFRDWNVSGGMGFNIAWNLSTIVNFDYAFSSEGESFYMQVGHQF